MRGPRAREHVPKCLLIIVTHVQVTFCVTHSVGNVDMDRTKETIERLLLAISCGPFEIRPGATHK